MASLRRLALTAIAALVATAFLSAHHSVGGQFDVTKSLTLTGTISKVEWINPHPYVHLDVAARKGRVTTWALSTLPIPMLRKAGLTKDALSGRQGEMVTITAMPARDGKNVGWITKITYSDGHYYRLFE